MVNNGDPQTRYSLVHLALREFRIINYNSVIRLENVEVDAIVLLPYLWIVKMRRSGIITQYPRYIL